MLIYDYAIHSLRVQIAKLTVHHSLSRKQQGLMFNNSKLVTNVQVISFPAQQTKPLCMETQIMYLLRLRFTRASKQGFLNWIFNNSNLFYVTKF